MKSNSRTILFVLIAISAVLNIGTIAFVFGAFSECETTTLRVMRAKEITYLAHDLSRKLYDTGVALSGLQVSKNSVFSERFDKVVSAIPPDVFKLKKLILEENSSQSQSQMQTRAQPQAQAFLKVTALLPSTIKTMAAQRAAIEEGKNSSENNEYKLTVAKVHHDVEQIQALLIQISDENKDASNVNIPARLPESESITMILVLNVFGNILLSGTLAVSLSKLKTSAG